MFSVTKEIYFCYGHRLMEHAGKCKNLHGHSVKAAITVACADLNDQGMVCDFADIVMAISHFIESDLDHNLLLHESDPLVPVLRDAGERLLTLPQHPTAEFLAKMIFEQANNRGLPVVEVTLWETASACATYRKQASHVAA